MTNDADANTRAQMQRLGLDRLLEFVAAYDSGFGHKPDPDPVLAFAKFASVAPAEIAVVGDTEHDLVAARAAGAVAVGVLSGPIRASGWSRMRTCFFPRSRNFDDWLCSIASKG